jgi:PAS domain S-box-containing protein
MVIASQTPQFDTTAPTVLLIGSDTTAQTLDRLDDIDVFRPDDPTDSLGFVGQVDCVVAEQDLDGTDGLTLFERIRERSAHLPFVLVTDGEESLIREAFQRGVTGHVVAGSGEQFAEGLRDRIEIAVEHASVERERERERTHERAALDAAGRAVAMVDENGRFSYINDSYCALFGHAEASLLGAPLSLVYAPADADRIRTAAEATVETGDDWEAVCRGRRADGSPVSVDVGVSGSETSGFGMVVSENI